MAPAGARGPRDLIVERIEAAGPVTFAEFMETALYCPGLGYYTSGGPVWGADGDYITSLDVSPAFALMMAKQAREAWELLGSPSEFTLVDAGAGRGLLTAGMLDAARKRYPDFFRALRPVMVDAGASKLKSKPSFARDVELFSSIDDVEPFEDGAIISNELLDALPFHRVLMGADGRLMEVYTGHEGGEFVDVTGEPSTPRLKEYFEKLGIALLPGQRAEVGLEAVEWITGAARKLAARGFVITMDYGLPARELYAPERPGTLLCHHRHTINDEPYERVGEQDITSHVDFTSIRDAGLEAGLLTVGFTTQLHFLLGLGVLEELIEVKADAGPDTAGSDTADALRHNQGIKRLLMPGGMGDTFKALVQSKGVEAPALSGLSFKNGVKYL